jgi:cysteine sulfinate desulfinase/cysteine desulfurase-like protein
LAPSTGSLRDPFPHLQRCVYLDTAAAGLTWQGHGAAVARFYDEVKSRGYDARPEWQAMTRRVRERLAAWMGVASADLTFVSNTTEALNHVALGLRLSPGDRIVLADDEFPSVLRPWAHAAEAGAEIVHVPVTHQATRGAALLAAIDDRTRVLAVSHTHSSTGTTLALPPLVAACRAHDALLVVDGIQALGAVPVDLAGVDVYAASFFKWMLSGFGIGVLVTSPRARARLRPAREQRLQQPQHLAAAAAGRDHGLDAIAVEHRADRVAVARQHACQHRDEAREHLVLAGLARAEVHRRAEVEQEPADHLAILVVVAHVQRLQPRGHVPVDAAHVVVRLVLAHVGEVESRAAEQRAIAAVQQPVEAPQHRPLETAQQPLRGLRRGGHGCPAAWRAARAGPAGARSVARA